MWLHDDQALLPPSHRVHWRAGAKVLRRQVLALQHIPSNGTVKKLTRQKARVAPNSSEGPCLAFFCWPRFTLRRLEGGKGSLDLASGCNHGIAWPFREKNRQRLDTCCQLFYCYLHVLPVVLLLFTRVASCFIVITRVASVVIKALCWPLLCWPLRTRVASCCSNCWPLLRVRDKVGILLSYSVSFLFLVTLIFKNTNFRF